MSDETADRIQAGDPNAVDQVRAWIRAAFSPYRSRFREDAEDLEQEVLLDVLESVRAGNFQGRSSFATFVKSFVHHKAIDKVRAARRRDWVDLEGLDLREAGASALEQLARTERVAASLRALQATPESCRELWQMLRDGLSYQEMGQSLGIAEGTVRVRVLRCRRKAVELRDRILKNFDEST